MKTLNLVLTAIILIFSISVYSQKTLLKIDFDTIFQIEDSPFIRFEGAVATINNSCNDKAILISENDSYVQFEVPQSGNGIGVVKFDSKVQNIAENGFTIKLTCYSTYDKSWHDYDEQKIGGNNSICLPKNFNLSDLKTVGMSKFRITLIDFSSGEYLIDNVEFIEMTEDKHNEIRKTTRIGEVRDQLFIDFWKRFESRSYQNYQDLSSKLKNLYYNELKTVTNIYNYVGHIDISTQMYSAFDRRAGMANPLSYDEFSKWIVIMETLSDSAQVEYISDLKKEFERQKKQYDIEDIKTNSTLGKVFNFATDIGNMLTGGKLKSVINSFKGIFASVFSKSNIDSRKPIYKESRVTVGVITGPNRRDFENREFVTYVKDSLQEMANIKLLEDGKQKYRRFSSFFQIVEEEYSMLDAESYNWKQANASMGTLIIDAKKFAVDYISIISPDLAQDDDFIENILDNKPETMKQFSDSIDLYFARILGDKQYFKSNKTEIQVQIEDVSEKIKEVYALLDRYDNAALKFENLFSNLKNSLENRANPWKEWMQKEGDRSFEKASEVWQVKRDELVNNILPELIEKIHDHYVEPNLRDVEPVWRID